MSIKSHNTQQYFLQWQWPIIPQAHGEDRQFYSNGRVGLQ
jgi:hypothetical protein